MIRSDPVPCFVNRVIGRVQKASTETGHRSERQKCWIMRECLLCRVAKNPSIEPPLVVVLQMGHVVTHDVSDDSGDMMDRLRDFFFSRSSK